MKRWLPLAAVAFVSIVVVLVVIIGRASGTPVPDVRGNIPIDGDREGIQPVLDAGFCVDYLRNASATSFESDGQFEAVSDSYVIGGQIPEPGSRLPVGSTVTIIVGGSPLGGVPTDWDEIPVVCP